MGHKNSKAKDARLPDARGFPENHPGYDPEQGLEVLTRQYSSIKSLDMVEACPRNHTFGEGAKPASGWRGEDPNYDQVIRKWREQKKSISRGRQFGKGGGKFSKGMGSGGLA